MQQQLISDSIVCSIVLKNNTHYQVTEEIVKMFQATYPKLDIYQQLNEMAMWCFSNPSKRKTQAGVLRFINSWLSRAKPAEIDAQGVSTRNTSLEQDLSSREWAQ